MRKILFILLCLVSVASAQYKPLTVSTNNLNRVQPESLGYFTWPETNFFLGPIQAGVKTIPGPSTSFTGTNNLFGFTATGNANPVGKSILFKSEGHITNGWIYTFTDVTHLNYINSGITICGPTGAENLATGIALDEYYLTGSSHYETTFFTRYGDIRFAPGTDSAANAVSYTTNNAVCVEFRNGDLYNYRDTQLYGKVTIRDDKNGSNRPLSILSPLAATYTNQFYFQNDSANPVFEIVSDPVLGYYPEISMTGWNSGKARFFEYAGTLWITETGGKFTFRNGTNNCEYAGIAPQATSFYSELGDASVVVRPNLYPQLEFHCSTNAYGSSIQFYNEAGANRSSLYEQGGNFFFDLTKGVGGGALQIRDNFVPIANFSSNNTWIIGNVFLTNGTTRVDSLQVTSTGTPLLRLLSASASLGYNAQSVIGEAQTNSFTVTGAIPGDSVSLGLLDLPDGSRLQAWISATNTVSIERMAILANSAYTNTVRATVQGF